MLCQSPVYPLHYPRSQPLTQRVTAAAVLCGSLDWSKGLLLISSQWQGEGHSDGFKVVVNQDVRTVTTVGIIC